ncbi:MAG: alpha/beta hydrolase [Pseudomonadota bacterium]
MRFLLRLLTLVVFLGFVAWGYGRYALSTETHRYAVVSDDQRAVAQAYLDKAIEPLGAGWRWDVFSPAPEIDLRVGRFEPPPSDPKGVIVVVPGYTAPLEMLAASINRFYAAGYIVHGFEYRGQGLSSRLLTNPEKGHVEDYSVLAADLASFISQVREPGLPLHVYAISQGAHITMRMAGDELAAANSYALVVPMGKILTGGFPYEIARTLAAGLSYAGLGEMFAPGRGPWDIDDVQFGSATSCNANPERAQIRDALFVLDERKRTQGPTARWVHETMQSTDRLFEPGYPENISQPVIMFTAGQDTIVDTDAAVRLCDRLGDCTRQHFAGSRHCIGLETDAVRDAIIDGSLDHFGGG